MAEQKHQKTIQENRAFLVKNIDVINTSLLDWMIQEQLLSHEQMFAIKDRYTSNLQMAGAVLDHLYRRPNIDWEKFLNLLKDHGLGHIPGQLQSVCIGGQSEADVTVSDLQQLLAKTILAQYDEIKLWRWHDNHEAVTMEEQYVELMLIKVKKGTLESIEQPLPNYQEVFKQQSRGRGTIYLRGEPGAGKSTFSMRICVDWAKSYEQTVGKNAHEEFEIKDFTFVLPIFLRSVKEGMTLRDVVKEAYRLEWEEADALCHNIQSNQKSILFILDGLDEFNQTTSQEITDILHKRLLPHVNLFITSRHPSSSVFKEDEKPAFELSLGGFSKDGVTEYIRRFYQSKKEDGEALLETIRQSKELVHLSHFPSVLLMMATLWHFVPAFANTLTGFYLDYIRYLLGRYEEKRSSDRKSYTEILDAYHENLMKIGELATSAMMKDRVDLSFPFDDVIKQIGEETGKLGILIKETDFFCGHVLVFPHKTLQDFFFSFFIVNSTKSRQKELLMSFCSDPGAFTESSMIIRFVVGLGGEELQKKIATLIKGNDWQLAEMYTQLQLDYLAEHKNDTLILPSMVKLGISNRYPASHYVKFLNQNGSKIRKMWLFAGKIRHWRLLQYLHAPQLTCLQLYAGCADWACSVDSTYTTHTPDLTCFPLKELIVGYLLDDIETSAVVSAVVQTKTLLTLAFASTLLNDDTIHTLTRWLKGSHLTNLELSHCGLTPHKIIEVLSVLPPSLHILGVAENQLAGLAKLKLSGFTASRLQSLDMSRCDLTSRDVLAVIDAAPETLTDLDVSENCRRGEEDLVRVTEMTTQLNKLKILNLCNTKITRYLARTIQAKVRETHPNMLLLIHQGLSDQTTHRRGKRVQLW